jgi:PAS domain S-box-containing protein
MKKNNLKYKIQIAFAICVLFILIVLGVMFFYVNNTTKESIKIDAAVDILNRVENIVAKIQMAEADKRKFLLNGNSTIKKSYDESIEKIEDELDAMTKLYSKNASKKADIETLKNLFEEKKNYANNLMKTYSVAKINPALLQMREDTNRSLLESTYVIIKKIKHTERVYLQTSNEARLYYAKILSRLYFVLTFLFFISLLTAYFLIKKDIQNADNVNKQLLYNTTLLGNISDAIVTSDANYNITNWNKYAESLYGYKEEEVVGKNIKDLITLSDKDKETFFSIAKERKIWKGEMLHYHKDGSPINVLVSTSAITNNRNEFIGAIALLHNITDKINLQEEFKLLTQKLQIEVNQKSNELNTFFDRVPDAFFALDNNWNYTFVNKTAEKLHGRNAKLLLGKNIWELHPDLIGNPFYNALHEAKKTQQEQRSEFYYAKEDKWFEDLIYPGEDGISIYYYDITDKKKSEIGLKTAHARLNFHLNNTPLAVIEFDSDLNILQWSKKAEEIFEWTADEVSAQKINIEKLIKKEDRLSFYEKLQLLAIDTDEETIISNKCISKSGKEIYCEWYNSFVKEEDSKNGVILSLVKNVTNTELTKTELANAEVKFRSLVEESMVGVYIRKEDKIIYANPRFAEISGYTIDEIYKNVETLNEISKDDKEKIIEHRKAYAEKKTSSLHYEFKGIKKDGTFFHGEVFGTATILNGEDLTIGTLIDITDRKEASEKVRLSEEALKVSIERFELVAKATNDAIWDWDIETDILTGNEIFCKLFGMDPNSSLKFNSFLDKVHVDDKERLTTNYVKALKNKDTLLTEEFRFKTSNEKYSIINDRAYILYDKNDKAYRMLGAMQDITEMKEAENKIIVQKELSESIINSLPGTFYIFNKEGKFYLWNKNFETVAGYGSDEIVHMNPLDYFIDEEKAIAKDVIEKVFSTGYGTLEILIAAKDGRRIPYYLTGKSIMYENELCVLGVGIDISERKKAENALLSSEKKYRILFNDNPMPMWILSLPDRKFMDVNYATFINYGYSKEEFLEMGLSDLHLEKNWNFDDSRVNKEIGNKRYEGITDHKKKDGTIIKVNIITHNIIYEGSPAILALANDVSDKFEAEEKLQKSAEAFRELASNLETVRESERTHMAREIHDELGQQLTGLKMDISWINKRVKSDDVAVQQKIQETIQLIDKTVITVRRIATELRPSILDDLGLISAMEWQSDEFEKRSEIKSIFTTNVGHIAVSNEIATGIFRIFQESLTNVSRHSRGTEVLSTFKKEGNMLTLTIVDNGVGFNEDEIAQKRTLGLLGMKERVGLINGTYQIKGKNGNGMGASVIITVPLS